MLSKILLICIGYATQAVMADYSVTLTRINQKYPVVDYNRGESDFTYNYNPSYVPLYDDKGDLSGDALIIRAQQAMGAKYSAGPSFMPLSNFKYDDAKQTVTFDKVTTDKVVFQS